MASINFFNEETDFKLPGVRATSKWIRDSIARENKELEELNFIFCSDLYLANINKKFLDHDTFTDIITFDNSNNEPFISGDIFISVDRVKENAQKYKVPMLDELHRVIIHGVLHLIGYTDKTITQKNGMREREDAYLSLRRST